MKVPTTCLCSVGVALHETASGLALARELRWEAPVWGNHWHVVGIENFVKLPSPP